MPLEIVRHSGASFTKGADQVHIWATGLDSVGLASAWGRIQIEDLAGYLKIDYSSAGELHAHASAWPFLPTRLFHELIADSSSPLPATELSDHAYDARLFALSFGIHRRVALERAWPAWPLLLGRMPALILGAGRRHCIVPMNLAPQATGLAGIAGSNKAVGRDLLASYGLPPAPGGLAGTPQQAVDLAQRIGWPVVLKRLSGGNSDGVILNVTGDESCLEGARELLRGGEMILVEKIVEGIELRVHFVDGRIHRIVLRVPRLLRADGKSSLRTLIENMRPGYLKMAHGSAFFERQVIFRLWEFGVRQFPDIDAVVPEAARCLSLGKDFHRLRDSATEASVLHRADRERIEAFLKMCGNPSGAFDLIVRKAGVPLAQGGAVIEMNMPSGMWYLEDGEDTARSELDAWTSHIPGFRRARGRVPFWIAPGAPNDGLLRAFRSQFPSGKAIRFADAGAWPPVLTEGADALLIFVEDEDIRLHGLPMNLAPVVWGSVREYPYLAATLDHAGPSVRYRNMA